MSWIYALAQGPSDGVMKRVIAYAKACMLQQLSVCNVSIVQMNQTPYKKILAVATSCDSLP